MTPTPLPQATTVPSSISAKASPSPAATCRTPIREGGWTWKMLTLPSMPHTTTSGVFTVSEVEACDAT